MADFFEAVLAGVKASRGSFTYAHCEILTNQAGVVCPLCLVPVKPNIGHVCHRKGEPKPVTQPKQRKAR